MVTSSAIKTESVLMADTSVVVTEKNDDSDDDDDDDDGDEFGLEGDEGEYSVDQDQVLQREPTDQVSTASISAN